MSIYPKFMKKLQNQVVTNKNIFLRVDFNVPVKYGKILDDSRIIRTIPTLQYLIKNQAKIIVASHFGRPKGKKNPDFSLNIVFEKLKELLPDIKINFIDDSIGDKVTDAVAKTNYGEILLLENLRFYQEETENDPEFSQKLSSIANLYVNEAFSCCHRSHASICGITKYIKSCAGFLLQDEIDSLNKHLNPAKKPLFSIIAGSKISTKIDLIDNLIQKSDHIFIAGGMANTFFYALDKNTGKSLIEKDLKDTVKAILLKAKKNNCEIILPIDVATCDNLDNISNFQISKIDEVSNNQIIADIGPETIKILDKKISDINTVIWNGPLGIYEILEFSNGTNSLAKIIAKKTQKNDLISVAGGGDIVSALNTANLSDKFTYISTAGGAFLEWLEGRGLPGIESISSDSNYALSKNCQL
jgi:phosphoglycerate kinase